MTIVDVLTTKVEGALTAPRSRVIWKDGVLAVFTPDDHQSIPSERPVRSHARGRDVYTATTTEGEVRFEKWCGCGGFPLKMTRRADLLARL